MQKKRPNILFITADQQRADCFGFEGRNVITPHLDLLAAQGTRFNACITPNVVCQPSRASILTGLLPRTHGVHDNGIDLDLDVGQQGFAGALSRAGYNTAFFGKAHFSTYHTPLPTGRPECVKSSNEYDSTWFGPYMGFEHVELMLIGHNWFLPEKPPYGLHYEQWFYQDGLGDEKNRLYAESAGDTKGAAQTHHSRLPVAWHNSTWTADRAIKYINDRDAKEPFCAWVSFPDPHHPFDCPEPWSRLHRPEEVDLPKYRTRDFSGRPWWHERVLTAEPTGNKEAAEIRKKYSRIPPQTDDQLREIIANTYGQISLIDHNVGRILSALDESGIADNTIVIYSCDHGDFLGDHGLLLKGPMHYEGLLRVPLIFKGPSIPANKIISEPVSTLDLSATFMDYAAAPSLQNGHGQSLRPLIDSQDCTRDFALNEWELLPTRAGVGLSLRTVRTKQFKLTLDYQSEAGELYDLKNDPDECVNRFDDGAFGSIQRELKEMLDSRPDDALPNQIQVGTA